jgi:hypothetical protein
MGQVQLLRHQAEFLTDKRKFLLLKGGIGSGKSFSGSHFILNRVHTHPRALHFIGANTYDQLLHSTLAAMFGVLEEHNIPYNHNRSSGILSFFGGQVLCKSMENFNMRRGIEIGSFWLDEVRDLRKEAFDMMMGRLRDKRVDNDLQGRLTTSPAGFNWLFDYFDPRGDLHNEEFGQIEATSYDNIFLPDGYIPSLEKQYSEELFRQEILGEYVNLVTGQTYKNFGLHNIQEQNPFAPDGSLWSPYLPLVLACDFNINPMAWTIGQHKINQIHWNDEIWLQHSDTEEATEELCARIHGWHHEVPGIVIIGDSSGKALKTSASGKTDYDILHNKLREHGIKYVDKTPEANPMVKDRVNTMNSRLKSKTGEVGLTISRKRCPKACRDLERVTWKEGASAILDQDTDKTLTHSSDGMGYAHCILTPIKRQENVGKLRVVVR